MNETDAMRTHPQPLSKKNWSHLELEVARLRAGLESNNALLEKSQAEVEQLRTKLEFCTARLNSLISNTVGILELMGVNSNHKAISTTSAPSSTQTSVCTASTTG